MKLFISLVITVELFTFVIYCFAQQTSTSTATSDPPEDANLNFTQLAIKYGQKVEQFHVTTKDGYILTLFHIFGDKTRPVFLQHGFLGSSDDFIIRGNTSLAIQLAQRGYDVWVGNARGNRYSTGHVTLDPSKDRQYFQYSFNEFGYYDSPANIDFILNKTGQTQLNCIGHSEGTTTFFVLGSTRPEYNKKIKVFIALSPVCFFNHIQPLFSTILDAGPVGNALLVALKIDVLLEPDSILRQLLVEICDKPVIGYDICIELFTFPIVGEDREQLEPEFVPILLGHFPIETSRQNLNHFVQIRKRRKFAKYDYGPAKNLKQYRSVSPPEYDLSKVIMPMFLIRGKNDRLTPKEDVNTLSERLGNVVEYHDLKPPKFNHIDFVVGRDMFKELFPRVFNILERYN